MFVTLKGKRVEVGDEEVNVGNKAHEVTLQGSDLSAIKVGGVSDKIQILASLPSLDTPVCANEARRFNIEVAKLEDISTTIISMDLPFASKRFCASEGIKNIKVATDFKTKEFSKKYGVLIKEGVFESLCARAIFIISKDGYIIYKEIVPEIADEPDYCKALEVVKNLCRRSC